MERIATNTIEDNNANTQSINGLIDEFISNSILKGNAWNSVRSKLNNYSHILTQYNTCTEEFNNAIKEALISINDCIDNYNGNIPLPTKIVDFNAELEKITTRITEIENEITQLETKLYTDEFVKAKNNNNQEYKQVYNLKVKAEIDKLNSEKADLVQYKLAMQMLYEKYETAKKKIEAAYIKISILDSKIDNITPSSKIAI